MLGTIVLALMTVCVAFPVVLALIFLVMDYMEYKDIKNKK